MQSCTTFSLYLVLACTATIGPLPKQYKVFEKVLLRIEKILITFLIFNKFFLKMNLLIYILRVYINRTHSKFILLKIVVLRAFTLKLSKAKNVIF